jgi:biotin carboxylase
MTSARRVVVVGFGRLLLSYLERFLPAGSVLLVEDPDIVAKRRVLAHLDQTPCVRDLIPARYHQDLECVDAVAASCADEHVDAVLPGLEYAVPGAAHIADRLGLPGATAFAADLLCDKLRMREAVAAAGIRSPQWRQVRSANDVADFLAAGPAVLKPANRQASLGVQLLEPADDPAAAWAATVLARDHDMLPDRELSWRYLVERIVSGREYSAEALVQEGEIRFLNVTGKLTAQGRHPVELGHVVPAALTARMRRQFSASMSQLVKALKFASGILHAEWIADKSGLVFIESAGRIPGDSIVDLIDTAYEFSLAGELVNVLSGRLPAVPAGPRNASAIRFLTAPPGIVSDINGLDKASGCEGVVRATVRVRAGDQVGELRSSWDRVGSVVTTGASPQRAERAAASASALIQISTAGYSPVT